MCWRALIDGQPVGDFVDQAAAIDFVRAGFRCPIDPASHCRGAVGSQDHSVSVHHANLASHRKTLLYWRLIGSVAGRFEQSNIICELDEITKAQKDRRSCAALSGSRRIGRRTARREQASC